MLKVDPVLLLFAGLILFVHLCFLLVAGKLFRLNLAELVIASNANMGGPTTAVAMAVSRKWNALVLPAPPYCAARSAMLSPRLSV